MFGFLILSTLFGLGRKKEAPPAVGGVSKKQQSAARKHMAETQALIARLLQAKDRYQTLIEMGEADSLFGRLFNDLQDQLLTRRDTLDAQLKSKRTEDVPPEAWDDLFLMSQTLNANFALMPETISPPTITVSPSHWVILPTEEDKRAAQARLQATNDLLTEYWEAQRYVTDINRLIASGYDIDINEDRVALQDNIYGQLIARGDEIDDATQGKQDIEIPQAMLDEYFLILTAISAYARLRR